MQYCLIELSLLASDSLSWLSATRQLLGWRNVQMMNAMLSFNGTESNELSQYEPWVKLGVNAIVV